LIPSGHFPNYRRKRCRLHHFRPALLLETGVDFMIGYASYGGRNYRKNRTERANGFDPLEKEYRELQELRERVKKAETAAKLGRARKAPTKN
jgi:hypothetical protein